MTSSPERGSPADGLERTLVVTGGVVCVVASAIAWSAVARQQPMWPLPGLYFLEMVVVSMLPIMETFREGPRPPSMRGSVAWAAVGVLVAFAVLGILSVGLLYAPAAGLIGTAAIVSNRRQGHNVFSHLGVGAAAAVIQASVMLALLRVL